VSEALECLGGNGYTEAFPLARRYREQPVMAVWEGSGNVIALDVLRALSREPDSYVAFDAEVGLAAGASATFDAHLESTRRLVREVIATETDSASRQARRLVAELALSLQASLLIRNAPSAVSDAFIESRLGADRAHLYGELPASADLAGVLERA
jgi:putative acyl-CoA dehydrogenase